MSLLRTSLKLASLARQCGRLTSAMQHQRRGYAEMAFTFGCPGEAFYHNANVKQVDVPSLSGSFGILPEHVPSLAVMKPGVLTVFELDGSSKRFFVSSGSISINDDSSVQVLAEEAVPVDRLDAQTIRDGLTKAQQEANAAATDMTRAEAQVALECYESLQKALESS